MARRTRNTVEELNESLVKTENNELKDDSKETNYSVVCNDDVVCNDGALENCDSDDMSDDSVASDHSKIDSSMIVDDINLKKSKSLWVQKSVIFDNNYIPKVENTVVFDFICLLCSQIKCLDSKLVSFLIGIISCKTCNYFMLSPMFMMCTIWLSGILNKNKEKFISVYFTILLFLSWFLDEKLCIPICELMFYCYEYYTTKKFDVYMGSSTAYAFASLTQPTILSSVVITLKHYYFYLMV